MHTPIIVRCVVLKNKMNLKDLAQKSIDKMLTKKEEGITKFLKEEGPKNILEVAISQKDTVPIMDTSMPDTLVPIKNADELFYRMRNPYVNHLVVKEIGAAIFQEQVNLALDQVASEAMSYSHHLYRDTKNKIIYCTHKKIDNLSAIHDGICLVCGQKMESENPTNEQLDLEALLLEQISDGKGVSSDLIKEVFKLNPHFILPENITVHGELRLNDIKAAGIFLPDGMTVHGYMDLSNSKIIKLPKRLKIVNNSLCLNYTYVTYLPDDLIVDETIYTSGTSISKKLKEKYKLKYKIG